MTHTAMTPLQPQRLRALERANQVRLARAELKRRMAVGDVCAGQIILDCPPEASRWSVGELLMTQPRWGIRRCRKFLERNHIGELKLVGELTERQKRMLAAQLGPQLSPDDPEPSRATGELQHA